jgi:Fe-S-cluster containining protein
MKLPIIQMVNESRSELANVFDSTNKRKMKFIDMRIACKPGCNHCCSRFITLSIIEALIVRDALVKSNKWVEVLKKCRSYNETYGDYDPDSWYLSNIKCPVLDTRTGMCKSHVFKPVMCTTHFVLDTNSGCDPWNLTSIKAENLDFNDIAKKFYSSLYRRYGDHILASKVPLVQGLILAEGLQDQDGYDFEAMIKAVERYS